MTFSKETLMAYADGELDAATRQAIEAAMARDPELAAQVERYRALRAELRDAFGGVLEEPVPEHLLDAARTAPAGARENVTDLASVRAAREPGSARRWTRSHWGAIAASLVVGVLAGRLVHEPASALLMAHRGEVVASGALARALNGQPAGEVPGAQGVVLGMSFVAKSGQYCRTFTAHDGDGVAGLVCHADGEWRVQALSRGKPGADGGEYRMAGTELPPTIVRAIEETIAGEALDAEQEAAALERGWQR